MKTPSTAIAIGALVCLMACEKKTTVQSGADSIAATDAATTVNSPGATGSDVTGRPDTSGGARPSQESKCDGKTITSDGVGALRIGMSVESAKSSCNVLRDTTLLGGEGMMERRLVVSFPPDVLDAEIVDGRVWRLDIRSPGFRTADSLGVGSRIGDLSRLGRLQGLVGEGVLVVVSPDRCGLSFVLSGGIPAMRVRNWDSTALAKLPRSTTVQRVLVLGCSTPR